MRRVPVCRENVCFVEKGDLLLLQTGYFLCRLFFLYGTSLLLSLSGLNGVQDVTTDRDNLAGPGVPTSMEIAEQHASRVPFYRPFLKRTVQFG
jgi:hypothetical protein